LISPYRRVGTSIFREKEETLMSIEDEVRKASKQFYAGLNSIVNGDSGPLADIWSHETYVTTMHPIGGRDIGWDAVRGSFGGVAKLASKGTVELKDQLIHAVGDLAYEVGIEKGLILLAGEKVPIEHRVTNIYRKEGGAWKIVHHHTDISPLMIDVLKRVQAKAA
jgi:ketosteroid isomerase-like protein